MHHLHLPPVDTRHAGGLARRLPGPLTGLFSALLAGPPIGLLIGSLLGSMIGSLLGVPPARAAAHPLQASCLATSGPRQAQLVELYTSEACSSCPPADRWLSSLRGRPGVLAAAFHVDYWDSLGWPDRFAQPAFTARQQAQRAAAGARFVYTPQVLVNGRDWRGWPTLPLHDAPARVDLALRRDEAGRVLASARAHADAPARVGLWWARLEDGHGGPVTAGENRGATLRHDHVVRQREDLPPLAAGARRQWPLAAAAAAGAGEGGRPARLLLVATDLATGQPLQAVQLDCAAGAAHR